MFEFNIKITAIESFKFKPTTNIQTIFQTLIVAYNIKPEAVRPIEPVIHDIDRS